MKAETKERLKQAAIDNFAGAGIDLAGDAVEKVGKAVLGFLKEATKLTETPFDDALVQWLAGYLDPVLDVADEKIEEKLQEKLNEKIK